MLNSEIFGKPNEGIHAYRFAGIAIVDLLLTVFVAWIIAKVANVGIVAVLVGLLLMGVVAHRIFGVRTSVDKLLFDDK